MSAYVGSTEVAGVFVGEDTAKLFVGDVQLWPTEDPPTIDSFLTQEDTLPGGDQQWWNPSFRQGFCFTPTASVELLGVRWWRIAYPSATADITLCVAPNIDFEEATDTTEFHGVVITESDWIELLFDTPVALTADTEYCVWVSVEASENIDVARTASYFSEGEPSINGLMEAASPSARFNNASAGTQIPFSTTDAWYWIDPLCTTA